MGLTNHIWPISYHITPLVINALGGRHIDTNTHTHTQSHTVMHKQIQETRHVAEGHTCLV